MNAPLTILAAFVSALALYLPAQTQSFTRVTVDGRSIRMLVAGRGEATVVFESGLGGPLEHWGKVQPAVSRFARTVSYDRAGNGLSDPGQRPRDAGRIAAELRKALAAANVAPPYILVGHSMGGPYARVFAGMYSEETAALVLVDPTSDLQPIREPGRHPELDSLSNTLTQARLAMVPGGIPFFLIDAVSSGDVPFSSDAARALRRSNRATVEAESLEYRRWLAQVPGGQVVTTESGHNVPMEEPGVIVATIRKAIDQVAAGR
jgi:pimeloyl-ACP methyl ester carboxylesterase